MTASLAIIFSFFRKPVEPQKVVKLEKITRQQKLNPRTQVMLTTELESSQMRDVIVHKEQKKVYFAVNFGNLPSGKYESFCKIRQLSRKSGGSGSISFKHISR